MIKTRWTSRSTAIAAVLCSAAFIGAGCGSDGGSSTSGSGSDTRTTSSQSEGNDDAASGAVSTTSPAADLQITLDRLLGEHMLLASFVSQKGLSGDKDFEAAAAALDQNSVDLGDAIGSVYGDEAKTQFLDGKALWRDHIGFFVDYTVATAKKDKKGQNKAVGDLTGYTAAFSNFLATATGLPQDALQESITMHVGHLKGELDAYAAKDYETSYETTREGYAHMMETGNTLAGGIAEQKSDQFGTGDTTEGAVALRQTMGQLLGEHAILAIMATQSGLDGSADFEPIAAALDKNTDDLGAAVGSVAGKEGQEAFEEQWRAHIGFFVDYTVATAKKDDKAKQKAVTDLEGYVVAVSEILSGPTGIPAKDLEAGVSQHVQQLAGQVDAYAAGDYEKAYSLTREAYEHMWMTGDALAAGIVKESPDKFA